MTKVGGLAVFLVTIFMIAPIIPIIQADTVIASESIDLLPAGNFENSDQWEITSTSGFTNNPADYTIGMVADSELSFTHERPDNFGTHTSWASSSPTGSNYSLGEPDSYYSWSKGPEITVGGFDYTGLYDKEIENVSLLLHFEIPNALYQDTVRIILENNGPDKLVREFAHTSSGVFRMNNPLVIEMDDILDWDWNKIVNSQFTIDYVSQGTNDDSEVRLDALGVRVKYHMPWYSFENIKANHELNIEKPPVIDISPYEGEIQGLTINSCGLTPDGSDDSYWTFDVEAPYGQELGRIHIYATGNYTIGVLPDNIDGDYSPKQSGDLLDNPTEKQHIRIDIQDGCIEYARVDVNNPELTVNGRITGSVNGLSSASVLKFAVGEYLVETIPIDIGYFSFSVPIGHAFPLDNSETVIGIASRFQWSSDGNTETTITHIDSMSISGGFELEYDYSPSCQNIANLQMTEDEGGFLMSLPCQDDMTERRDLTVIATSSDESIVSVSSMYSLEQNLNFIELQTIPDASGESRITVNVYDNSGSQDNVWTGIFTVTVSSVSDMPVIEGLPIIVYIDLGDTLIIPIDIYDPDSDNFVITTSKSWATLDEQNNLVLKPIDSGLHTISIVVNDTMNEITESIMVDVSAKPDLLIESLTIKRNGADISDARDGDIVEIYAYIRNEGRGSANEIDVRCYVNEVLVDTKKIDTLQPGALVSAICDTALSGNGQDNVIRIVVDSTLSIEESNEDNNLKEMMIFISLPDIDSSDDSLNLDKEPIVIILSIVVILVSIAVLQLSPSKIKKPYNKRK
ncbi:MAG: hypothetical protein HOF57_06000 [Euryarchaeota archaeon]|nr:hypothetical protein [Euryarchaeota archaeon]MBT4156898.1 hypothetical protein [Euryarchaeota archaeon]MBT4475925.1 hypothetical protein [Euryarchaeota archaeon]